MAISYHKSVSDLGGAIGVEIFSGVEGALLPEILLSEQASGATISRKFYIANDGSSDVMVSNLSMVSFTEFTTILFESTGDAQVVGDLIGDEVDESPIIVIIPAGGHKSFWLQVDVPLGSTKKAYFNTVDVKQIN